MICRTCQQEKLNCFSRNKKVCKQCVREYNKKYYTNNHDDIIIATSSYRNNNRSKINEYFKGRRQEKHEELSQKDKEYYALNSENIKNRVKLYRKQNPEVGRQGKARYKARKKNLQTMKITKQQWEQRKSVFGNCCYVCSISEDEVTLCMDHVKSISKGGPHLLCNLRPICISCNSKKSNADHKIFLSKIRKSQVAIVPNLEH